MSDRNAAFLDQLEKGFRLPRRRARHGHNVVAALQAIIDAGAAKVFIGLGGNFVRASSRLEHCRAGNARSAADRWHQPPSSTAVIWCTASRR